MQTDSDTIARAFDNLLDAIETVISENNQRAQHAMTERDYELVGSLIETSRRADAYIQRVRRLRDDWQTLLSAEPGSPLAVLDLQFLRESSSSYQVNHEAPGSSKADTRRNRVRRGQTTPSSAYRIPILAVLDYVGGAASAIDVLSNVYTVMESILTPSDLEPPSLNSRNIRWKSTAHHCRGEMVAEGLLRDNSPFGIWEISSAGQLWLDRADDGTIDRIRSLGFASSQPNLPHSNRGTCVNIGN